MRQEAARRATEEQIQAQRRQTEREKAEIERETIRVRSMAEAEGRAHETKLAEDVNRRMLVERANAEREKWVAAINTTFDHIGGLFLLNSAFLDHSDLDISSKHVIVEESFCTCSCLCICHLFMASVS